MTGDAARRTVFNHMVDGTLKAASRRDAILSAATEEFAKAGFAGARVERIATAAGANKQLIFHYFGSKDGLYAAVVSALLGSAPEPAHRLAPPEGLRRYVAALAEWLDRNPGVAVVIAECQLTDRVPDGAAVAVTDWISGVRRTIGDFLDSGQRQGHFRDDIDAELIVRLCLGSALGAPVLRLSASMIDGSSEATGVGIAQAVVDLCVWR